MSPSAVNVAALLVLILPGFLSYRFAVWQRADPTQRSALWQLSEVLEHSLYVHLIGAALVGLVHLVLAFSTEQTTYAPLLLKKGPHAMLNQHFAEAMLWFALYPLFVIGASTIIGSYDIPKKVSSAIIWLVRGPSGWLQAKSKLLAWLPIPGTSNPQEPVWYYAFNTMSGSYVDRIPHVLVSLKNGDVYFGEVATYPIVLDTDSEKDFLIKYAKYYPDGQADNEQLLYEVDGVGAVLLNTANVLSILIYYQDISGAAPK